MNEKIVDFPRTDASDEERAQRVMNEAMRLSRFTLLERSFHVKWSAERLGITLRN